MLQTSVVEDQVTNGNYRSASDYLSDLIRADHKAKAQERLEALLLEGLEGEDIEWTPALADEIRREARIPR